MRSLIHFVHLKEVPILEQLKYEEALLRADERNWLIFNEKSSSAIVMGVSGQKELLVNQEKWQQHPIPLIRRFSGGGTVVVDENTFFVTFICQKGHFNFPLFPRHLMEWSSAFYRPLFSSHNFQLQENDYTLGEKKWGGNAQCITKERCLHHTSILWDYDTKKMDYLLHPPKAPFYRQGRKHTDFLCPLKRFFPQLEIFQQRLLKEIANEFEVIPVESKEIEKIQQQQYRKVTEFYLPN